MVKILHKTFLFLLQFAFFIALAGNLHRHTIIFALASSVCVYFLTIKNCSEKNFHYFFKIPHYLCFIFVEIAKSSWQLFISILHKKQIESGIVHYPIYNTHFTNDPFMLYLLITSITITPGTICLGYNYQTHELEIHYAFKKSPEYEIIKEINNLETKLISIFCKI